MLNKPDIQDEEIIHCLQNEYGLKVEEISFLPLGADLNTAVYRIIANDKMSYFLKLRRGEFNEAAVLVPKYLADSGLKQVIPPLATNTDQLWANLASFKAILSPFVEGRNAIERHLTQEQWIEFGSTLKKFHSIDIPKALTHRIPKEAFSSRWRKTVKAFLERIEIDAFLEPVAIKMALFLKSKSEEIRQMIERTENLASILQKQPIDSILCHADIHGWNLLVAHNGEWYIVDWDTLLLAPKERDLMFIGAGLGDSGRPPLEEETLFYQGYGLTNINHAAIAYYRYERIIEDIGVYCEQIFLSDEGGEDRMQSFEYLQSHFLPNSTIERAYQSDKFFLSSYR
ncbi:phosphotransferase [Candidatus Berkiella aquae]|uniref:Aminoglycoside phosphotransferase family protein n=1 Tax=Candidatus Berkiella aquae TaxID=295108 RepID=A0A0Q9YPD4_9GAMM|nr:aminoglycoside phosphotransferase family protein [Candidatus Berkiella aquae]MCS5711982.1 aminoglycoside phosphotransferase family protein [Candidatus Berkiella aquae]